MIVITKKNKIYNTKLGTLLFIVERVITFYGTNEVSPYIKIDAHFPLFISYKNKRITFPL